MTTKLSDWWMLVFIREAHPIGLTVVRGDSMDDAIASARRLFALPSEEMFTVRINGLCPSPPVEVDGKLFEDVPTIQEIVKLFSSPHGGMPC